MTIVTRALRVLRRPTGMLAVCLLVAALANVAVPYLHSVVHGLEAFVAAFAVMLVSRLSSKLERREAELAEVHARAGRTERMAALTALAAGAAHELNTPLGTIAVVAKELERRSSDAALVDVADDARLLRAEVERCRAILRDLGSPAGELPAVMGVGALLDDVLRRLPEGDRARIVVQGPHTSDVVVPRVATTHALTGIVRNALQATKAASSTTPVIVGLGCEEGRVQVAVKDAGVGVPPDVLKHVGEPFFTTKKDGRGLGLWLARQVAEGVGGRLWIESVVGEGTTVLVELPSRTAGGAILAQGARA